MSFFQSGIEAQGGLVGRPALAAEAAPNPCFRREEALLLDGTWLLRVNGGPVEPVQVPFAPQARVNAIPVPPGEAVLHYATTLELPADWEGAVLHVEGADHEAEVLLNGQPLGRHAGAYDPFQLFAPRSALDGGLPSEGGGGLPTRLHALDVLVRDCSHARHIPAGKQERRPAEGAIFYGNMSGLWKSVWIERAGEARLLAFRPHARASGHLRAEAEVAGAEGGRVALRLRRPGLPDLHAQARVRGGRARFDLQVEGARPWSPAAPHLHDATLTLLGPGGERLDRVETYLGFRDFGMRDGYYRLNGEPFQFRGLLNQAIYPDTLYTPTDAHTLQDFEATLALGFNGERRHQTTPRHRDLWLADRMGYWLSIEMPCARDLRDEGHRRAALEEWRRILAAYAWHPCVLYLAPGNENWGLLDHPHHDTGATDEEREAFQYELGHATEAAAPPELPYAANDGWRVVTPRREGERHERLDPARLMVNVHDYADNALLRDIYGRLPLFPAPGEWSWNHRHVFHDGYSYDGHAPLVLSEVGGRACLSRPEAGVFAYGRVHHDPEAWGEELHELITLLGEMPVLRGGFVLTQTRDAGNDPDDPASTGEVNGVLDALGRPKGRPERIRAANALAEAAWARHRAEARA